MTSCQSSRLMAAASSLAVVSASAPASAGSLIRTPLAAPMARALRMAPSAFSGPIEPTVTWPPVASASWSPASMPYSSPGSRTTSTPSRLRVLVLGSSWPAELGSGTCLTHTTTFMRTPDVLPVGAAGAGLARQPGRARRGLVCIHSLSGRHDSTESAPPRDAGPRQIRKGQAGGRLAFRPHSSGEMLAWGRPPTARDSARGWTRRPGGPRRQGRQEQPRVDRLLVDAHLEVGVRPGRVAGGAHQADDLALLDRVAGVHRHRLEVSVEGEGVVVVGDDHVVAVADV